jgi:glycogen operon protein
LIEEPWDAAGTYVLGHHGPARRGYDWNDQFRDEVRKFVRGDKGMLPKLMTRLYGSCDWFPDKIEYAAHPYQSVNYITSHDGFTLYDLCSYKQKRNWANGEDNRDGPNNNYSWNCGHEGDDVVPPEVMILRRRQARNYMALLMLSNGTPLIRGGDEFLDTQNGNNNPYNQDNEISWLNWSRLHEFDGMHRFMKMLMAYRASDPTICRSRFWREDIRWYGPRGEIDFSAASRCLAYRLSGERVSGRDLYVMINGDEEDHRFTIHEGPRERWKRMIDTAEQPPQDIVEPDEGLELNDLGYRVRARSVVVLVGPPRDGRRESSVAPFAG